MDDFRLIETMRSEGPRVYLLDRHLERLSRSATFFSFACDLAVVRDEVLKASSKQESPMYLRLLLSKDGVTELSLGPLPVWSVRRLKLSSMRVNSDNVFLYHKTTRRDVYDEARRYGDAQTDVVLINERGEITETTIANVAVSRDGQWVTPRKSCGLLSGVMREELLARGEIVEGVIRADELSPGEQIRCFNALRGVLDVELVEL